jgi:signal transduction histidine kinase
VPNDVSQDVSLCLYRITQESLQNVNKHSGASSARVNLSSANGEIRLSISDDGKGFDIDTARAKGGLGLVSIDERLQRVNGKSEIVSAVGAGAKIEVRIPLSAVDLQR